MLRSRVEMESLENRATSDHLQPGRYRVIPLCHSLPSARSRPSAFNNPQVVCCLAALARLLRFWTSVLQRSTVCTPQSNINEAASSGPHRVTARNREKSRRFRGVLVPLAHSDACFSGVARDRIFVFELISKHLPPGMGGTLRECADDRQMGPGCSGCHACKTANTLLSVHGPESSEARQGSTVEGGSQRETLVPPAGCDVLL